MKRFWRIISILIAALMLLSVFVSCDSGDQSPEDVMANMTDKEKSDYLSEKTAEYYAKGATVDMTLSAGISGSLMGVSMSGEYSATIINTMVIHDNGDISSMSVENTESNVTAAGQTQTEKYTVTEGFCNGVMYYAKVPENKDGVNTVRLKSNCTSVQYNEYLKEKSGENPDFNLTKDCQTVTVTKNEDGSQWVLTFSDLTEGSTVTEQWGEMIDDLPVDMKISKFNAVLYVDTESLALASSKIDMEFTAVEDDCDMKFTLSVDGKFSLPEENASFLPEDIDSYKETDEIVYAYYATKNLSKIISSDDASSTLSVSVKINASAGSSTQNISTYKETDVINYGNIDGKFKYHILADVSATGSDDYSLIIKYNGDQQSIIKDGSPYSNTTQSSFAAKNFINSTLGAFDLSMDDIIDISITKPVTGETRVQLDLFMGEDVINSFAQMGFDTNALIGSVYNIVVNLDKDNNITSASLQLESSCMLKYDNVNSAKYTYVQLAKLTDISTADKDLLAE